MSARSEFDELLAERLTIDFFSDPSRRADVSGYVASSNTVTEEDARDFLRAWSVGLAVHKGRGQYLVGVGRVHEQFFWSGLKAVERRSFTLWLEPVITMGAIARLHLDHGWPISRLAAQSKDWAFDIVAMSSDGLSEQIAGEVKKTRMETDQLFELMVKFGAAPGTPEPPPGKARNAYKKVASLRRSHVPILWLIGPSHYEKTFKVKYDETGVVELRPMPSRILSYARFQSPGENAESGYFAAPDGVTD